MKQKFEPPREETHCSNQTGSTILSFDTKIRSTTISTPTDPPQGGRHGNHTDVYPTAFLALRTKINTAASPFKLSALSGTNNVTNSTNTTQTYKIRSLLRMKSKSGKSKKRRRKNPMDTSVESI